MQKTEELHRAIQVGLLHEVKRLVNDGANMDTVLGMRGTALCAAIETRNYEITQFLLESGCDVNGADYDGEPPLLLAIRKESPRKMCGKQANLSMIKLLLDIGNCNLNKVDPLTKKTALHFATEQNMVQVVRWLLDCKSHAKCDVNMVDANGNSPLHLAVLEGHAEVVDILVNTAGCLIKLYNRAGVTPLHTCARNGDVINMMCILNTLKSSETDQLEKSIEQDKCVDSELSINVNAITMYEFDTCLHIAARQGHSNVVELLLENEAAVDMKNNVGNTPLLLAVASTTQWQKGDCQISQLLLKKGANPNLKFKQHLCRYVPHDLTVTPLILAVRSHNLELVKLLLSYGADVTITDELGQTALYIALREQVIHIASFLLTKCDNITVNMKTNEGDTCLHALVHTTGKQDPDTIREIVKTMIHDKGAVIICNLKSETPVDAAFDYENAVLADALIEESDCDIRDISDCENLILTCVSNGNIDLLRVFLSHGIDIDIRCAEMMDGSLLFSALLNSYYKMAEFLVINGIDLRKEKYIFADVVPENGGNDAAEANNNNYTDDDESDDDYDDDIYLGSDDDTDIFQGNVALQTWIQQIASNPLSLQLNSLVVIRKYFINNQIPFKWMNKLSLPPKLVKKLRYQC